MAGVRKYPPIIDSAAWNNLVDYLGGESGEGRLHPLRKAHPIAAPETCVVFCFDDGLASHYAEAYPKLAAKGWRGTCFIMTSFIAQGIVGYMTAAQVKALRDAGWEIGNHTTNGPAFNTLTRAEIEAEVQTSKNWIEQNIEAPCLSFSYPGYIYLDKDGVSAKDLVARYHPYGCQGSGTGWDGYPSQSILRRSLDDSSYTQLSTWLSEAAAASKSLVLATHLIADSGGITPAHFQTVLDQIAASGYAVLPLRDLAARHGFPLAMWPEKTHIHSTHDHNATVSKRRKVFIPVLTADLGLTSAQDMTTGGVLLNLADFDRVVAVTLMLAATPDANQTYTVVLKNATDASVISGSTITFAESSTALTCKESGDFLANMPSGQKRYIMRLDSITGGTFRTRGCGVIVIAQSG